MTLIPPPQLPGFAPMNMMIAKKNSELAQSSGTSSVLRPAVRLENAIKNVDCILSKKLKSLSVLLHSVIVKTSMLAAITMRVPKVAIRVCKEILRKRLCLKSTTYCSSVMARNPNPPASTRIPVVMFMMGFSWNCIRESGNSVNPTLQKLLTAWNSDAKIRS